MFQEKWVTAVLLAGGSGSRFGGSRNKVYLPLLGKPMLAYSWHVLEESPFTDDLILVFRPEDEAEAAALVSCCRKPVQLIPGGGTRQESVLHAISGDCGEIVLIQDGARPLLQPRYVGACLEAMAECPGATVAVRSKDTVKLADEAGFVRCTTRRTDTWIVQTPQCFHRDVLLEGHRLAAGDPEITDDCMLLERMGQPVKLVEGDYTNIKVTTAEDQILAEHFLKQL